MVFESLHPVGRACDGPRRHVIMTAPETAAAAALHRRIASAKNKNKNENENKHKGKDENKKKKKKKTTTPKRCCFGRRTCGVN